MKGGDVNTLYSNDTYEVEYARAPPALCNNNNYFQLRCQFIPKISNQEYNRLS